MIVEPKPDQVGGETVIRSSNREVAIAQIEIEPLGFSRPMLREIYLAADPAETGMAL